MTKQVPLYGTRPGGKVGSKHDSVVVGYALVDDDFEVRGSYSLSHGRPRRGVTDHGRVRSIGLAREVCGLGSGDPRKVRSVNGDQTDCRRANLRVAEPGRHRPPYVPKPPRVRPTTKRCPRCEQVKPLDAFKPRRADSDYPRQSFCAVCQARYKTAADRMRRARRRLLLAASEVD